MSQSSVIPALQSTQEGKEHLCDMAVIRLQPLTTGSPEELRRWKHRQLASESWDAYERNEFSEPKLLHLPIYRKALNSLTWDIWFSLIHKNTFDVQTTCPLLKTSPPAFLEEFYQGYLRCYLRDSCLKNFHQIKHSSQLLGCDYF